MNTLSYPVNDNLLDNGYTDKKDKDRKKKKRKDKKKKEHSAIGAVGKASPNVLDKYNAMGAKGNVQNSLMKAVVDVLAGAVVGPALSATLGKFAPIAGAGLSFGGHYIGDESGVMRAIGISTVAHSVAKVQEYREPDSSVKDRLSGLKDDWLRLVMMGQSTPPAPSQASIAQAMEVVKQIELEESTAEPVGGSFDFDQEDTGKLDLSALDAFEQYNETQAMEFEQEQEQSPIGSLNPFLFDFNIEGDGGQQHEKDDGYSGGFLESNAFDDDVDFSTM